MNDNQVKEFITQARNQGKSDEAIFNYLQSKGVNFGNKQEVQAPTPAQKPNESFFSPQAGQASFTQKITPEMDPSYSNLVASKNTAKEILPAAGSIGGAILGAGAGSIGGPVGAYAGGVTGAGLGAAIGELANQAIGNVSGQTQGFDTNQAMKTGKDFGISEAIAGPFGAGLKTAGGALFKSVIPESISTSAKLNTYYANNPAIKRVFGFMSNTKTTKPVSVGESALEHTTAGTESQIGAQAERAMKVIWDGKLGKAFANYKEPVNLQTFFNNVENKINSITDETQKRQLLKALSVIKGDYKNKTTVSLLEFNNLKSSWANPVPEKAYKGENITGTLNNLRFMMSSEARKDIIDRFFKSTYSGPEVQKAFIDYSNLKSLQELGIKARQGKVSRVDSLFSMVRNLALFPVATVGGKVLYKTGAGIEFIGGAGLNKVSDVFNEALFGN